MDEANADTSPLFARPPSETEKVDDWRLHVLVEAGYPVVLAERLAVARDVDLHQAVALVASGCPARLAAEILL